MAKKLDLKPILQAVNPEEAITFFRQKGYRIGFDHQDVWQQEHQAAFTVAKGMHQDLLLDIRKEVDKALAIGTTVEEFSKQLTPRLQARGWWGKQELVDPVDGQAKLVQLGSPRRLQRIFDTNLATAYSEGQWERIQRNQELFPYLEYLQSASVNPRHTHLGFVGLVLLARDPFWQSHLPIKEWDCKCTVVQHNRRSLEREGLQVGKAPPEVMRTLVNKRTGEVMQVPTGVDPAFNYPPGGRRANLEKMLVSKVAAGNAYKAQSFAHATRQVKDGLLLHPLGKLQTRPELLQNTGFNLTDFEALIDNYAVIHTFKSHGNARKEEARGQFAIEEDDFGLVPMILAEPDAVFADGKTKQGRDALVFTKLVGDVGYWLVQEIRPSKKTLAMVSMRKKAGAWRTNE